MKPEEHASALQRWLASPGTRPPADLDEDVVEAVYTLRPDLAPAPRVSAADILASITSGPLAGTPSSVAPLPARGGEVVPFPGSTLDEGDTTGRATVQVADPSPARHRGVWRWVGGASGLALLGAAAASVMLMFDPQDVAPSLVSPASAPQEAAPPPLADEQAAPVTAASEPAAPPAQSFAARSAPKEAEAAPSAAAPVDGTVDDGVGGVAFEMDGAAAMRDRASIPELAAARAAREDDALADLGALDPNGWRAATDPQVQVHVDLILAEAAQLATGGDLRAAGDRAAKVVEPPARAGQYAAWTSARYYLRAGVPRDAEKVARRGLDLSPDPSPERTELQRVYDLARARR